MGALDFLSGPLRSLLGVAEQAETDVERHVPTARLEAQLEETIAAIHRAAESMERHVVVVEALADSLPPLTESVTQLTDQLTSVMRVTAPVAAAERELSRVERLFGRRRPASPPPSPEEPADSAGADQMEQPRPHH